MKGRILSINISLKKGEKKHPVMSARLVENFGIEGDAHGGEPLRQVSMLSSDDIGKMKREGLIISYGDFGENITAENIDSSKIRMGDKLRIGETELEVTQIGKVCHTRCNIFDQVGYCIMPESGIFLKVIRGGEIKVGDEIEIMRSETDKNTAK